MKAGQASKTAVLVCMGRAVAHGDPSVSFVDPTALALLPEDARARVQRVVAGDVPKKLRDAVVHRYLQRQSKIMVARTIEIDDAVREAKHEQVVILGAGLDGRAWRMPELAHAVVFEVDHPDSQRDKRARVAALSSTAREIRFVPVDFARDDLDSALSTCGHEGAKPTTWIWEGVVMYLEREAIDATLAVVARRSAPGSRLVVLYHRPAFILNIVGLVVRRMGEPLRSVFTPEAMRTLLAQHDFEVVRDRAVSEIGSTLGAPIAEAAKVASHLRVVIAERR